MTKPGTRCQTSFWPSGAFHQGQRLWPCCLYPTPRSSGNYSSLQHKEQYLRQGDCEFHFPTWKHHPTQDLKLGGQEGQHCSHDSRSIFQICRNAVMLSACRGKMWEDRPRNALGRFTVRITLEHTSLLRVGPAQADHSRPS